MRLKHIITTALLTLTAAAVSAQSMQFTDYLGKIDVGGPVLPLAGDTDGNLLFGTFDGPNSTIYKIDSPQNQVGTTPTLETIFAFPQFVSGRGLQSLEAVG